MRVFNKRNLNISTAYGQQKVQMKIRGFSFLDVNGIETSYILLVRVIV